MQMDYQVRNQLLRDAANIWWRSENSGGVPQKVPKIGRGRRCESAVSR